MNALEDGLWPAVLLKADVVANLLPYFDVHLLRHAPRHGHSRHAAWLSACNALSLVRPNCIPSLHNELRDLLQKNKK